MKKYRLLLWFSLMVSALLLPVTVHADSNYDEDVDGDLSDDRTIPTALTLSAGLNRLHATSVQGDLEYVTIALPSDLQLEQIVVSSYVSSDTVAFVGIQQGAEFTEPNTGTAVGNLLGYAHFGPGRSNVGTDILDDMAAGVGSIGFTAPLTASIYTLWIQQTGTSTTAYSLDFMVAPMISMLRHDEAIDGDLSGDAAAPTSLSLLAGGNVITATSVRDDREYVHVSVPLGHQLDAMLLTSYVGEDGKSFAAVQRGTTFTEPPQGTTVGNLLGYSHMGPDVEPVGADLLDNMGAGAGARGFSGALASGDYTFWIQQTGITTTTYTLELVVAPVATQTLYSEVESGDLSGDRNAPTALTAVVGGNILQATSVQGDLEYFTLDVPTGHQLDAIFMNRYESADTRAFIAIQAGNIFTEPPGGTQVGNLLGYSHFGPSVEPVGSNILDNMGSGAGAIGFSDSLPSDTYTFWTQQAGANSTLYELNFIVSAVTTVTQENLIYLPLIVRK